MVVAIQIDGMEFHVEEAEKNPFRDHHQGDEGPQEDEPFQIAPEENLLQGEIEKHRRQGVSQQQSSHQPHIIFRCSPEPEAVVNTTDYQADKEQKRNHQIQGGMAHHPGCEGESLLGDINTVNPPVRDKENDEIKNRV